MNQTAFSLHKPTYRPLPDCLTIAPSAIEGLGLFAAKDIPANFLFGPSHLYMGNNFAVTQLFADGWIRTPWAAMYNMDPELFNCETIHHGDPANPQTGDYKDLRTLRPIMFGTEIIVQAYTLYLPVPPR